MRFDPENAAHVQLARDAGRRGWLAYRPAVDRAVEVLADAGIEADPDALWRIATAAIPPVSLASRLRRNR